MDEKVKYAWKAKVTAWALNVAIGLQVLLGALTTGLSAATTGRQVSIDILHDPIFVSKKKKTRPTDINHDRYTW